MGSAARVTTAAEGLPRADRKGEDLRTGVAERAKRLIERRLQPRG